ncbi:fission 1 protein [Fusarium oxysporum f. sp. albedinis]|nr:fission 1 protein [Fusarium oxysporum f. sp. albedinis]
MHRINYTWVLQPLPAAQTHSLTAGQRAQDPMLMPPLRSQRVACTDGGRDALQAVNRKRDKLKLHGSSFKSGE